MKQDVSRTLYAYWNALRGARSAPERDAIDPAAIRDILAYTFLLDIAEGDPRATTFRLSGTRLNALFQRDLKGEAFAGIWSEDGASGAPALLADVLDDRSPVLARALGAPFGYPAAEFELLLLPLRHHGRTHARALGALSGTPIPSWTGLKPVVRLEIAAFRTLLPVAPGRLGRFGSVADEPAWPLLPAGPRVDEAKSASPFSAL